MLDTGTVFLISSGSGTISALASFDTPESGSDSSGGLTLAGGVLYGTTSIGGANNDGTVFKLQGSTLIAVASFNGTNGSTPGGGVVFDASGNLYGSAQNGANGTGDVFEIPSGSTTITPLALFAAAGPAVNGNMTMDASGNVWGVCPQGGSAAIGSVFELPAGSDLLTTVATFSNADGGQGVNGGLAIDASGNVYGTTSIGTSDDGNVFEIAKGSGTITVLASFNGTDGDGPLAGVTLDSSGDIYGTTSQGGAYNYGTAFEIARGSNTITTLASFDAPGPWDPQASLTLDASGDLYGTTWAGGPSNYGTVFEIAHGSSTITTLATFNSSGDPGDAAVTFDAAGNLYGTTGSSVFEIPKGSPTPTTVASFDWTDGGEIESAVLLDPAGNLYGTALQGGSGDGGTVFEIAQGTNTITDLFSFSSSEGYANSPGQLMRDGEGNLYVSTTVSSDELLKLMPNSAATLSPTTGPNPSNATEPLTFTASVSGGVPSGEAVRLVDTSNNNAVVATGTLSNGSVTLAVPAGALRAGTHNLVAVYGGDANFAASESAPYTQTVLPAVTGISPSVGPDSGGTTVTITGVGFTGATAVDFGSTTATSFTINAAGTQITAVDPAGTKGTTVDVTVVDPYGTSPTTTADQFTYGTATLPPWVGTGSAATWNPSNNTLTVTGAATIIADPGSVEANIVATSSADTLTIAPATSPTDVHLGGITLTGGASIVMSSVGSARSHSDHNVLVIGALGAASDPTISIDSSSKLDLGDNDLIVHTGSSDTGTADVQGYKETNELKAIEALAADGRNVAPGGIYNGTWTGNGLTSSAAATADDSANAGYEQNILAVEQNSDMYLGGYSSWTVGSASETLGANDIIVKYTYNGDLNLDGAVDGNAATIFSTFYDGGATSGNTYAYGDLNGDGKIDGNDATIFSTVYGNGLAGSGLPQL